MEQIQKFWTGLLDALSKLVIPDWGALIALLPLFVLAAILLWIAMTFRAYAVLGPRQRGRQFVPVPPAGLHAVPRSRRSSGPSARRCSSSGSSWAQARSCSPPAP
jgi:hypothetical protein